MEQLSSKPLGSIGVKEKNKKIFNRIKEKLNAQTLEILNYKPEEFPITDVCLEHLVDVITSYIAEKLTIEQIMDRIKVFCDMVVFQKNHTLYTVYEFLSTTPIFSGIILFPKRPPMPLILYKGAILYESHPELRDELRHSTNFVTLIFDRSDNYKGGGQCVPTSINLLLLAYGKPPLTSDEIDFCTGPNPNEINQVLYNIMKSRGCELSIKEIYCRGTNRDNIPITFLHEDEIKTRCLKKLKQFIEHTDLPVMIEYHGHAVFFNPHTSMFSDITIELDIIDNLVPSDVGAIGDHHYQVSYISSCEGKSNLGLLRFVEPVNSKLLQKKRNKTITTHKTSNPKHDDTAFASLDDYPLDRSGTVERSKTIYNNIVAKSKRVLKPLKRLPEKYININKITY
jgi:hypothetical protein